MLLTKTIFVEHIYRIMYTDPPLSVHGLKILFPPRPQDPNFDFKSLLFFHRNFYNQLSPKSDRLQSAFTRCHCSQRTKCERPTKNDWSSNEEKFQIGIFDPVKVRPVNRGVRDSLSAFYKRRQNLGTRSKRMIPGSFFSPSSERIEA